MGKVRCVTMLLLKVVITFVFGEFVVYLHSAGVTALKFCGFVQCVISVRLSRS